MLSILINAFQWTEYFYKYLISKEDLENIHIYNSFFSLKWSLIVLNEFLSENWKYRINADPQGNLEMIL